MNGSMCGGWINLGNASSPQPRTSDLDGSKARSLLARAISLWLIVGVGFSRGGEDVERKCSPSRKGVAWGGRLDRRNDLLTFGFSGGELEQPVGQSGCSRRPPLHLLPTRRRQPSRPRCSWTTMVRHTQHQWQLSGHGQPDLLREAERKTHIRDYGRKRELRLRDRRLHRFQLTTPPGPRERPCRACGRRAGRLFQGQGLRSTPGG
jgi:hypothetical protein